MRRHRPQKTVKNDTSTCVTETDFETTTLALQKQISELQNAVDLLQKAQNYDDIRITSIQKLIGSVINDNNEQETHEKKKVHNNDGAAKYYINNKFPGML